VLLQSTEHPVFLVLSDAAVSIFVDGVNIISCNSLPVALSLFFIAHYIFNLHFGKNCVKTMMFLQYYAFLITESSKDAFSRRCLRGCVSLMENLSGHSGTDGANVGASGSLCQSGQLTARRKTSGRKSRTSSQVPQPTKTTSSAQSTESTSVMDTRVNTAGKNLRKKQKKTCSDFLFYK